MWPPRGQRWETLACVPSTRSVGAQECAHIPHTSPPCLDLHPPWALSGTSWDPDEVSGNSGEPEELQVWGLGFWSPSLCWFPSIKPQALKQPRGRGSSRVPGLPSPLWHAPPFGPVADPSPWCFLALSSPHPAESAFSRRVEGKAQNHFEETNSSSQNSSGECAP